MTPRYGSAWTASKNFAGNGDDLDKKIEAIQGEVRGLEAAKAILGSPGATASTPQRARQKPSDGDNGEGSGARRRRALKPVWRQVLQYVASRPERRASIDEMSEYSDLLSLGIQRNTFRSQMSIYADLGYVERVAVGLYRVTDAGLNAAGVASNDASASDETAAVGGEGTASAAEQEALTL